MTTVYFIRHAESDITVHNGRIRPLTEKGRADCRLVTEYLSDKNINAVISSPYKRAIDTVADFARCNDFKIHIIEDFRERKSDSNWLRDTEFFSFIKSQWDNFSYKLSDGECLSEVQKRNIAALNDVLLEYRDKNIVIGTHGTALSTIINYYDNTYGYEDFMAMVDIMPWVVKMDFNDDGCIGMNKIDLFQPVSKPDYDKCTVRVAELGELRAYRFSVIFARYMNKWLYCRAKSRDTFETAGGTIESGETALDAAKRELFEETGALRYDITPAFDYSVHLPTGYSNGQVFFARINELGDMPDFEMAETRLFEAFPDKMRFPQILPVLYDKMQSWLNLQSSSDEIWDIYDSTRKPTGRKHRRADKLNPGDYHLAVHVWLQNSKGQYLITKRAPTKGYPGMWECPGGSAVSGEDSLSAAIREAGEETGLRIKPENGQCLYTFTCDGCICDVWLFRQDLDINNAVLQDGETVDIKYATKDEIRDMMSSGKFIAFHYAEDLFLQ